MRFLIYGENTEDIKNLLEKTNFEIVTEDPDMVAVVGGDGTLMEAEKNFPEIPKFILKKSKTSKKGRDLTPEVIIEKLVSGRYKIDEEIKIEASSNGKGLIGLNEIIVHRDIGPGHDFHSVRAHLDHQIVISFHVFGHAWPIGDDDTAAIPVNTIRTAADSIAIDLNRITFHAAWWINIDNILKAYGSRIIIPHLIAINSASRSINLVKDHRMALEIHIAINGIDVIIRDIESTTHGPCARAAGGIDCSRSPDQIIMMDWMLATFFNRDALLFNIMNDIVLDFGIGAATHINAPACASLAWADIWVFNHNIGWFRYPDAIPIWIFDMNAVNDNVLLPIDTQWSCIDIRQPHLPIEERC